MKQAYEKKYGDYGTYWVPVELTGLCKKVTGGPDEYNPPLHYRQAQRRLFGIPFGKYWRLEDNIKFCDPVVETIYECKCGEAPDETVSV